MATAASALVLPTREATGSKPSANLAPVAPDERIHALDLLRGWALFGVLWSNLNDWYGTTDPVTSVDHALSWTQQYLIESRFYSLLIVLFGIGFGIQLTRANARSIDVRNTYYRRSAALLTIGVVHGSLIWGGDILTIYALVSFALVMFRTASNRQLVTAAILLYVLGSPVIWDVMYLAGLRFPIQTAPLDLFFPNGSWLDVERARLAQYLGWLRMWGLRSYPGILSAFITGLWAVKSGYLRRVVENPASTRRLLLVAAIAAAVGYASWTYADVLWPIPQPPSEYQPHFPFPYFQLAVLRRAALTVFDWTTVGSAIAYACALLLLSQRPRAARALRPLAAAGRMGLTTYLTQSVVCTLLFYSYGLGWYGTVGFTGMLVITLVIYACQMAASVWWLKRFRFGPAEWLWRTLTYGKLPMRVVETAPVQS